MHSLDKASFEEIGRIFLVTYILPKWTIFFKKAIPSSSKTKYQFNNSLQLLYPTVKYGRKPFMKMYF